MFMQLEIAFDDDFNISLVDADDNRWAHVFATTQVELGMWDEGSRDFSYERDAERLAMLLGWQLTADARVWEYSETALAHALRVICEPGGVRPETPRLFIDIETTEEVLSERTYDAPTPDMIVVKNYDGDILAYAKYEADWQLEDLAEAGFEFELTFLEEVGVIING